MRVAEESQDRRWLCFSYPNSLFNTCFVVWNDIWSYVCIARSVPHNLVTLVNVSKRVFNLEATKNTWKGFFFFQTVNVLVFRINVQAGRKEMWVDCNGQKTSRWRCTYNKSKVIVVINGLVTVTSRSMTKGKSLCLLPLDYYNVTLYRHLHIDVSCRWISKISRIIDIIVNKWNL